MTNRQGYLAATPPNPRVAFAGEVMTK